MVSISTALPCLSRGESRATGSPSDWRHCREMFARPAAREMPSVIRSSDQGRAPTRILQIRNASTQIVFLDEGRLSAASWTVHYDQERWWDQITARHGEGTNFSFADGHGEYWKWRDARTLEVATMDIEMWQNTARHSALAISTGNVDLHRIQRGVFGQLGYTPEPCPDGICPIR